MLAAIFKQECFLKGKECCLQRLASLTALLLMGVKACLTRTCSHQLYKQKLQIPEKSDWFTLIFRCGISYGQMLSGGIHSIEESVQYQTIPNGLSKLQERQAAASHADSILDLKFLSSFGERYLLSASADGIVKAWK